MSHNIRRFEILLRIQSMHRELGHRFVANDGTMIMWEIEGLLTPFFKRLMSL